MVFLLAHLLRRQLWIGTQTEFRILSLAAPVVLWRLSLLDVGILLSNVTSTVCVTLARSRAFASWASAVPTAHYAAQTTTPQAPLRRHVGNGGIRVHTERAGRALA